jgi:tripartite-type tricarboxylate transporter receptor subunit TctC
VVGYGAGGGTDIIARIVADALGQTLGQPVIVENKPALAAPSPRAAPPRPHRTATRFI